MPSPSSTPSSWRRATCIASLALAACSPAQDWRDVRFDLSDLKAQLPCKPDHTVREVPMGSRTVRLEVLGCESGDVMLTLMNTRLEAGQDANAILQGWQTASLARIKAEPGQSQPWHRPGMLPLPGAQRISARGQQADAKPLGYDAVWGAWLQDGQIQLVHAALYDSRPAARPPAAAALAPTFFESIRP